MTPTDEQTSSWITSARWADFALAGGAILVVVGSLFPWTNATNEQQGWQQGEAFTMLGVRQGLAGGDAWLLLVCGVVGLALAGWVIWRRATSSIRRLAQIVATIALLWSFASLVSIPDTYSLSLGGIVATVGAVGFLVGAWQMPINADDSYNARVRRAQRLFAQGRVADAIALQERVLQQTMNEATEPREIIVHMALLARMTAHITNPSQTHSLLDAMSTYERETLTAQDRELIDALVGEIHEILTQQ